MDVAKFGGGKYQIQMEHGGIRIMSDGKFWEATNFNFSYIELIQSASERLVELEETNAKLVKALKELSEISGYPSNVSSAEVLAARVRVHVRTALDQCK